MHDNHKKKDTSTRNVFTGSAATEERPIKAIIKQKLKQNSWVSIKENKKTKNFAITAVCSNTGHSVESFGICLIEALNCINLCKSYCIIHI